MQPLVSCAAGRPAHAGRKRPAAWARVLARGEDRTSSRGRGTARVVGRGSVEESALERLERERAMRLAGEGCEGRWHDSGSVRE